MYCSTETVRASSFMSITDFMFYLPTVPVHNDSDDKCMSCYDIQTWHEIFGHCNFDDVMK